MKKLAVIMVLTSLMSCNDVETSTKTETPSVNVDSQASPGEPEVENFQIKGLGMINRSEYPITFFEPGNVEKTLLPGESCDYEIIQTSAIIKISGQDDQWGLERQKRYQIIIDSSGRWNIEQIR